MDSPASRLELSPINFLQRCAVARGDRPAVVHGEWRYSQSPEAPRGPVTT